jgi:hypothetical protein
MPVSWMRDGNTLFGSVNAGGEYRMVVEMLPDQSGWDWVAWRKNEPAETASRGVSRSIVDAMAEAEAGVLVDLRITKQARPRKVGAPALVETGATERSVSGSNIL